jgi:hypothetical protein
LLKTRFENIAESIAENHCYCCHCSLAKTQESHCHWLLTAETLLSLLFITGEILCHCHVIAVIAISAVITAVTAINLFIFIAEILLLSRCSHKLFHISIIAIV